MMNTDITAARASKAAPGNLSEMSLFDVASAIDTLLAMRLLAKQTAHLANHMGRVALEDFSDEVSDLVDERLEDVEAELRSRSARDAADEADVADLILRMSLALCPGERGMNIRLSRDRGNA